MLVVVVVLITHHHNRCRYAHRQQVTDKTTTVLGNRRKVFGMAARKGVIEGSVHGITSGPAP